MPQDVLLQAIEMLGEYALQFEKKLDMKNKHKFLSEPIKALLYFLSKMFYRGRSDRLSDVYAKAALPKVSDFIGKIGWQGLSSLIDVKDPIGFRSFEPRGYKFSEADVRMVYGCARARW